MESYVKSINSTKECKIDNSLCAFWIDAPIEQLSARVLSLTALTGKNLKYSLFRPKMDVQS